MIFNAGIVPQLGGVVCGSYVGDGANTRTITFDFEPAVVFIYARISTTIALSTVIAGADYAVCSDQSSNKTFLAKITGNQLIISGLSTMLIYANIKNGTYYYVAIPKA